MRRALLLVLLVGCASSAPPWPTSPRPKLPKRALRAGFLIVDGVYNTELTAPYDILHHTPFHTKPGIQVFTVAPEKKPIRTFEGLVVTPDYDFSDAPQIDILVVPSAEHSMDSDLDNEQMISWVRAVGEKSLYVVSLCDGAFVLAKAGLADKKASTTFPGDVDRYEKMYPNLDVRRNVSFVHDGRLMTSQGGAKSFDVAMYLVEVLYGVDVAKRVGRGLVIVWPPTAETMPAIVVQSAGVP